MSDFMELNRGSDLPFFAVWPAGPSTGAGANLTGYTVDTTDVHPALVGSLSVSFSDAATGQIAGQISWSDAMPLGALMQFRIRISQGATTTTTPLITVLVK